MIDRLCKLLTALSPTVSEGRINLTVPVVTYTNGELLELCITPQADAYVISSPVDIFADANEGSHMYFGAFEKHDRSYHFDIKIGDDGLFFKEYPADFSVLAAVNEFIRFFIMLDDFIINNDVIANEENYI